MKSIIISKELCPLSKETKEKLKGFSKDVLSLALDNEKQVNVYRIVYLSRGLKITGFIVEPKKKSGKLPCVIWNRGGSKDFAAIRPGGCYTHLARLALQGYIVFASQYSGGPGSEGVDDWGDKNIEDVLVLKEVIKEWPHTDSNNIGMIGFSRGGFMIYRALTLVKWIKAAIIVAGPTDQVAGPKFRKG